MDSTQRGRRTAVTNVRVFDGRQLLPLETVVIEGSRIISSGVAESRSPAMINVRARIADSSAR